MGKVRKPEASSGAEPAVAEGNFALGGNILDRAMALPPPQTDFFIPMPQRFGEMREVITLIDSRGSVSSRSIRFPLAYGAPPLPHRDLRTVLRDGSTRILTDGARSFLIFSETEQLTRTLAVFDALQQAGIRAHLPHVLHRGVSVPRGTFPVLEEGTYDVVVGTDYLDPQWLELREWFSGLDSDPRNAELDEQVITDLMIISYKLRCAGLAFREAPHFSVHMESGEVRLDNPWVVDFHNAHFLRPEHQFWRSMNLSVGIDAPYIPNFLLIDDLNENPFAALDAELAARIAKFQTAGGISFEDHGEAAEWAALTFRCLLIQRGLHGADTVNAESLSNIYLAYLEHLGVEGIGRFSTEVLTWFHEHAARDGALPLASIGQLIHAVEAVSPPDLDTHWVNLGRLLRSTNASPPGTPPTAGGVPVPSAPLPSPAGGLLMAPAMLYGAGMVSGISL